MEAERRALDESELGADEKRKEEAGRQREALVSSPVVAIQ